MSIWPRNPAALPPPPRVQGPRLLVIPRDTASPSAAVHTLVALTHLKSALSFCQVGPPPALYQHDDAIIAVFPDLSVIAILGFNRHDLLPVPFVLSMTALRAAGIAVQRGAHPQIAQQLGPRLLAEAQAWARLLQQGPHRQAQALAHQLVRSHTPIVPDSQPHPLDGAIAGYAQAWCRAAGAQTWIAHLRMGKPGLRGQWAVLPTLTLNALDPDKTSSRTLAKAFVRAQPAFLTAALTQGVVTPDHLSGWMWATNRHQTRGTLTVALTAYARTLSSQDHPATQHAVLARVAAAQALIPNLSAHIHDALARL